MLLSTALQWTTIWLKLTRNRTQPVPTEILSAQLKQLILAHQDLATTLLQWLLLALQVLLLYPTLLQQVSKLILPDEFSYLFLFYLFKIHLLPLGWTQQWLLKWRHWSSRWTKCTKRSSTARATERRSGSFSSPTSRWKPWWILVTSRINCETIVFSDSW